MHFDEPTGNKCTSCIYWVYISENNTYCNSPFRDVNAFGSDCYAPKLNLKNRIPQIDMSIEDKIWFKIMADGYGIPFKIP